MDETKKCKCCGRELPLSEFSKAGYGYLNTCKECVKKHKSEAKAAKKEQIDFAQQLKEAKMMRLRAFTPRDLMEELARRGIKGTMEIPETTYKKVDLQAFNTTRQ